MYRDRIKKLREKRNLTQEQLANIIGMKRGRYSQYETELDIMPLKHLNAVCNYFNVSLDYIFGFVNINQYNNNRENISKDIFSERLKEFRKENQLTQTKLAMMLNTVHPVITNYENKRHLVNTSFLYAICQKYGISADYLLGRIDTPMYFNK